MVHQAPATDFHRLDNVGNVPGAGIGLALVNDIARLHRTHPQPTRSETLGWAEGSGTLLKRYRMQRYSWR